MICVSCGCETRKDFKDGFCWRCDEVFDNDGIEDLIKLTISNVIKAERAREKDKLVYHTELSNAKLWYDEFVK
jgi:hypothetical protein